MAINFPKGTWPSRMRHRRTVAAALMLFALGSCAPSLDQLGDSYSSAGTEWILTSGFQNIAAVHLEEVDLSAVALNAMQGLNLFEPSLEIGRSGGRLSVRIDGDELGDVRLPSSGSPADWAQATVRALEMARKSSSGLREASSERIIDAMFDGALANLDRYSRYASPKEARENRANRDGYGGIGVTLERLGETISIVSVMTDGPAAKAGIKAGDHLLQVDQTVVVVMKVHEIVSLVRGPVDTAARLVVQRAGAANSLSVNMRRALILPPTVAYEVIDGTAVIRISGFNNDTAQSLGEILKDTARDARRGTVTGAVLDLRANPGGLLDQAVAVTDLFLEDGQIVTTRGRHPDSMQRFAAGGRDLVKGLPMAVLVNGGTASAAEIVAAALQDRGRAVLIGTRSHGKGTVQTVIRLPNDGELTLTWARFHAPSGYVIDRLGVLPTICTSDVGGDLDELVKTLSIGRLAGLTDLARRRAGDDSSTRPLQPADACPRRPGGRPGDIDLEVAKRISVDPSLYAGALEAQVPGPAKRPQAAARPNS